MQKLIGDTAVSELPVSTQKASYSLCGLGNKWCYAIYLGDRVGDGSQPTVMGFETNKSRALIKVHETATKLGVPSHMVAKVNQKFARLAYRKSRAEKRMAKDSQSRESVRIEYLYTAFCTTENAGRLFSRYRIAKRTAKRVYLQSTRDGYVVYDALGRLQGDVQEVTGENLITPGEEWKHFAEPLMAVNRIELERDGFTRNWEGVRFYADVRDIFNRSYVGSVGSPGAPWWSQVLDLGKECSRSRVRAAYRRLAQERHPDHGGNTDDFIHLEKAYREALKTFHKVK